MPSVPECHVEVRPSPTAGNGLFATRDIPAGSTILIKARPLIGELDLARLQDTCHNCFLWAYKATKSCPIHGTQGPVPDCPGCAEESQHPEVKSCTGCKKVKYCSKVCHYSLNFLEHNRIDFNYHFITCISEIPFPYSYQHITITDLSKAVLGQISQA